MVLCFGCLLVGWVGLVDLCLSLGWLWVVSWFSVGLVFCCLGLCLYV